MSRQRRRTHRFKLRSFYVWHRYMGISAALIMLIVAGTGILLNHTEDFQLDSTYVESPAVLDWYGVKPPEQLLSYPAGERYVTLMGDHLYLNRREIEGEYHRLTGAAYINGLFVAAVSDSIVLLTPRGEIVEQLRTADGVPAGITALGVDSEGALVVRGSHDAYQPDDDFLKWTRREANTHGEIAWVRSTVLPAHLKTSLQNHFLGEVLPQERLILDLHSGRFFGSPGPWVYDLAAVLLILLALSGTWIWLRRRR